MKKYGFTAIKRQGHMAMVQRMTTKPEDDHCAKGNHATHEAFTFSGPYFQPTREDILKMVAEVKHCRTTSASSFL